MDFLHESSHLNNNLASFTIMEDYVVAKLIKIFNKMPSEFNNNNIFISFSKTSLRKSVICGILKMVHREKRRYRINKQQTNM